MVKRIAYLGRDWSEHLQSVIHATNTPEHNAQREHAHIKYWMMTNYDSNCARVAQNGAMRT